MTYAPIALFTYSRADHTRAAVESLLCNAEASETDLYIFSDGPKTEAKTEAVMENRRYIRTITGFKSIHIVERKENWGLANSLIAGITDVVNQHGRVIVVEDDLTLSPYFLRFMNEALEKYKDDDRVSAISAFLNPVKAEVPSTFFLRYFACWGWATWQRAWALLNTDPNKLLRQMRWRAKGFNIGGTSDFYGMLYCQKLGLVDSWAIRFYASSYLAGKLVLFPGHTLAVQNGMDGTGTHSEAGENPYSGMTVSTSPIPVSDIPVEENRMMFRAFADFYRGGRNLYAPKPLYYRLKSFARRLLGVDYD